MSESNPEQVKEKPVKTNKKTSLPVIDKNTSPDVMYNTFLQLNYREEKLKEHLGIALKAQKNAELLYEKEKSSRIKIEQMFYQLSDKCDQIKVENQSDRTKMLDSFKNQSDKINDQIGDVTEENKRLLGENQKYRERIIVLLEQKEKFIKDAGSWRDISQGMRKEMERLRDENDKLKKSANELTAGAVEDKRALTKAITTEKDLRELISARAKEFSNMCEKSTTQSKYILNIANDMKSMKKDLLKFQKQIAIAQSEKLKCEKRILSLTKEKLNTEAASLKKEVKIKTLEKLCRALQSKSYTEKVKNDFADANKIENERNEADKENKVPKIDSKGEESEIINGDKIENKIEIYKDASNDKLVENDSKTTNEATNEEPNPLPIETKNTDLTNDQTKNSNLDETDQNNDKSREEINQPNEIPLPEDENVEK